MPNCTLMNMCMIHDPSANRVLVQDKVHPRWGGITFPGGHVDEGESLYASVVREVKEETGLSVSHLEQAGLIDMYDPVSRERRVIFLYKTTHFEGELVPESPEGRVYWIDLEQLAHIQLAPNTREYLRVLMDDRLLEAFVTPDAGGKSRFAYLPGDT